MAATRLPDQVRQTLAQQAKGECEYCRCPEKYCPDSFTVDHVVPRYLGGTDDLDNLAWACFGCNGRKHAKTKGVDLETQELVALFDPRQHYPTPQFSPTGHNDTF